MASRLEELNWSLRLRFSDTVVNLCVAAIQVFMWTYMLACHFDAPLETRKRRLPYLIASLTILVIFTVGSVMKGVYTYNLLFEMLPNFENIAAIRDAYYTRLYKPGKLLINVAFRISDGVLVHRCYVVWFDHPWVAILPACVLLAGTGISLRTYIPLGIDNDNAALDTADVALTVGLNILITLFISFRLIRAQRKLSIALPNSSHKLYLGIVAILVESAAPVAIFGIAAIIAAQIYSFPGYRALPILNIPFVASLILSPQLIIFRVALGQSWSNRADTSAMLSRSIRFNDDEQARSDAESLSLDPSCR